MTYRIMAIDGHSLTRPTWEASGAVAGPFLSRLFKLQEAHQPAVTAVAWDHSGSRDLRRAIAPSYKAGRAAWPEGFGEALADLQQALRWWGVWQYTCAGEADDALATLARTRPGPILLVSGDKDLVQLVGPGVDLLRGGELIRAGDQVDGIPVERWLDYQTLRGDPVDGVPGVKGIGPTKAKALLEASPGVVALLLQGREDANAVAMSRVAGAAPALGKVMAVAIADIDNLMITRRLVELQTLELEVIEPQADPDAAAAWLTERGLGWMVNQ